MLFILSQFTIWLESQTHPQKPVILFTVQLSPHVKAVDITQLHIRKLWERCDWERWKDTVKEKFRLHQILKIMKVLCRKTRNKLRSKDIESATVCGDDGMEAGRSRVRWALNDTEGSVLYGLLTRTLGASSLILSPYLSYRQLDSGLF